MNNFLLNLALTTNIILIVALLLLTINLTLDEPFHFAEENYADEHGVLNNLSSNNRGND